MIQPDDQLLLIQRRYANQHVLAVFNKSNEEKTVRFHSKGLVTDLDKEEVKGEVSIPPKKLQFVFRRMDLG